MTGPGLPGDSHDEVPLAGPSEEAVKTVKKARKKEQKKQSNAFDVGIKRAKKIADRHAGVNAVFAALSKYSNHLSIGGFGPIAGRYVFVQRVKGFILQLLHELGAVPAIPSEQDQLHAGLWVLQYGQAHNILAAHQVQAIEAKLREEGGFSAFAGGRPAGAGKLCRALLQLASYCI